MASTTPDIMVGFDSDEGASMNKLSQIIEMLRKALFGVIYVMSKETSSSRLVIVSGSLMQFFQILGFAFNRDRKFPLHPQAASALLGTLPFFTIAGWKHSSAPTKGGAIFALALCTVILVLACAVYVGYSFVQNSFKYMFPLKILRQFAVLITSIGFIPIATIFIQNIRCEIDSNVACYIGTNMNTLIFLIPLSIMFVIFCFIVQLTYFEDDPCKPSVMGRCHSRAEVLALIMRFLLTAFWELLPAPKYNLFIIVAMTLLTFLCAFVYTWYLPFYRLDICEIKSTLSWMQCWAAIAVTVAVLNDDISDPAPVVAFYIGIPIVVIASNLLLKARKIWIRDTPVQKLNSAFEVQLKAHLLMIKVSDAWMDTGKKDAVSEEEFNNVCRQSEEVYLDGVKKFSNSSLVFLFRGQFYLTVLKNTHTGMRALSKASERSPQLDEQFLIYRRRKKKSEESTGNSNNDIITSIAYEQYLKDAIDNDWNAAISQIRFWEDIQIASINIEELNDLAANVSKYLDRAQQNYLKMLKMAQRTPTALKTYAGFLSDLLNEKESAAKILNQAEEAQHNAKQGNKLDGTSEGGLQGGVVVVSGEDGSIGVITKTNDYLCKILGYSRNELLGKNISILVPDPWKSPHHSMIQSFLESGNSLLTKRSRRLFAEHKDGTLIPGVLIIRENNESDEMMEFMAIFSTLEDPLEIDTNYVILELTSSGAKAIGWTRGCKYLFAKTNFLPENVNILSWMPFFNEIKSTSEPFIIRASPAPAVDIIQSPTWNKNAIYNVEISIEPRQIEAGQYGIMRIVSQHQLFTEVFAGHIAHELLSCQDGFADMPESVIESLCHDLRMLPSSRRERIFELASKQLQDRKTALQILEAMHEDANLANAGVAPGQALSAPENPNEKQDSKEELDDSNDDSDSVTKVESTVSTKKSRTPAGERAEGDTNDNDGNFRHLLSNSNASSSKLLPQLKYVRRLLFVGLLTSVITVIGSFVFFNSTIAHYTASSSLLTLASERPFHSLSIVFATQWLLTMNAGIESIDQISNAKQMLSTNAQSLKDFNRIIRDNQQDVSKQFLAMEQDISVSIVTSFQGSSQTPIEKASPISATASLADAASKLYTTDLQLISVNNSDVKFIVEVQSGDLISHLESSTDVWRREILDNLSNIQMIAALFSTAAIVLLFLLIAVFVVPAMQTFKSNQYRGLMVFTQVPVNEIEMLRKRSLKRLRDLRAARSELFAVSDHDDFTHEDDIRQSHSSDIQASHRNLKELAARKRSVALGWKLSLKLFSLVLTLLAFVAIVFAGIGQSTLISSMANNVAVQTWSQFRRMKVREVLLTLQVFGAPLNGTSFGSREHQYLSAMAKFDELNKIDYDLTYGSSSLSLPGVFYYSTLSDTEALLTFEDGCMLDSMKVTACDTIQQGLLTNGLRVAVNQFSSQSRSLVASLYTDHIPKFDPGFQMNVFSTLRELERSFLQPSLQYGILLINTRLDDSISVFQSRYLALIVFFTFFLLMLFFAIYEPTVKDLNLQAKHMGTMILCMPDRILQTIANIEDIFDSES